MRAATDRHNLDFVRWQGLVTESLMPWLAWRPSRWGKYIYLTFEGFDPVDQAFAGSGFVFF